MSVNLAEAERFLSILDPDAEQFTFQTFDDDKDRSKTNRKTLGQDPLAKIIHGRIENVGAQLSGLSGRGAGIFITVNATNLNGRLAKDILRIRSLFVDLDGSPLEPVLNDPVIPPPHIVIESSPSRWHCYWLVDKFKLDDFEEAQKILIARFNSDKSIFDLPRVLRLPGYPHQKSDPFLVRIQSIDDKMPFDGAKFLALLHQIAPPQEDAPKAEKKQHSNDDDRLNTIALQRMDEWVPKLFPKALKRKNGYRITSEMLGRDLEEDLSITANGIKDFGVHDMGDARAGKRTAISIIMEYGKKTFHEAVMWLRDALGMERLIVMKQGDMVSVVQQAEDALINADIPIFVRGGELVTPINFDKNEVVFDIRRDTNATILMAIDTAWLQMKFAKIAKWGRWSKGGKKTEPKLIAADPEIRYATLLLANKDEWRFRQLHAVVTAPTLDSQGNCIEVPGYDARTRLLLDFPDNTFPKIPDNPTMDDAEEAMRKLEHPLRGFPFTGETEEIRRSPARSVALSAMLCALVRKSMRTAPLHGFDAPTAGTGKSILAEGVGLLATGAKPASMAQGKTEEEDEKRLSTILHAGDPVILMDNCERPVRGDFLCSMLSQQTVQARILGLSERRILPSTALVLVTGNNLIFSGDVSRRVLRCSLDAQMERPDQRKFDFNFLEEIRANRSELVVAGLTILRAYKMTLDKKPDITPMGSFEDYDWIRGALIWLGHPDPAETREEILDADPRKKELGDILELWLHFAGTQSVTLGEIGQLNGQDHEAQNALRTALIEISGKHDWNSRAIGWWMRKQARRIVRGKCFVQIEDDTGHGHSSKWKIHLLNQQQRPKMQPETTIQ